MKPLSPDDIDVLSCLHREPEGLSVSDLASEVHGDCTMPHRGRVIRSLDRISARFRLRISMVRFTPDRWHRRGYGQSSYSVASSDWPRAKTFAEAQLARRGRKARA
jgi:hypothetical protein